MLGLFQEQNEDYYFNIIQCVLQCGKENNLDFNVSITKEMIHDFRKTENTKEQITIDGTLLTACTEYKYLGCFIQDRKWCTHLEEQFKTTEKDSSSSAYSAT